MPGAPTSDPSSLDRARALLGRIVRFFWPKGWVRRSPAEGKRPRCIFPLPYMMALFVDFDSAGVVERVRVDD